MKYKLSICLSGVRVGLWLYEVPDDLSEDICRLLSAETILVSDSRWYPLSFECLERIARALSLVGENEPYIHLRSARCVTIRHYKLSQK